MTFCENLLQALKLYWKAVFVILYPIVLLPIFLVHNIPPNRCIYVIVLMAGLWITDALPLPITALIPVAFFPLMGILDTNTTARYYLNESSMLFVAGFMLATAVEASQLHRRVSLHIIRLIGFSPRKLHVGFSCVTMFISMWISNTATTALMVPILLTTLKELEANGIGKIYEGERTLEEDEEGKEDEMRRPTRSTMGYFISIAYAATIGGTGYLTGTAGNLEFKGIYETTYPNLVISSGEWFLFCIPYMLITMTLTLIWIEVYFMGLFRPKSSAAQEFSFSPQDKEVARVYILDKLQSLGRITFHEIAVGSFFIFAILLLILRKPTFMPGWGDFWEDEGTLIKDASGLIAVIVLLFLIPKRPVCYRVFSPEDEKRPKGRSNGLLMWKFTLKRVPWGLLFLIGAGFAIAEGANRSGLTENVTRDMEKLDQFSPFPILALTSLITALMTQATTNVAVCGIIMPVLAMIAKASDLHPEYIMFPAAIACSFGYLLPVSTPPNALIADYIHMPVIEMIKVGIVVLIISYLVLLMIFAGFLPFAIKHDKFPLESYMALDSGVS